MVQCRWRGDRGGSRYNALEKDKLFFSTAVGIVSCYPDMGVKEQKI